MQRYLHQRRVALRHRRGLAAPTCRAGLRGQRFPYGFQFVRGHGLRHLGAEHGFGLRVLPGIQMVQQLSLIHI